MLISYDLGNCFIFLGSTNIFDEHHLNDCGIDLAVSMFGADFVISTQSVLLFIWSVL